MQQREKLSAEEMLAFYEQLHRSAIERDAGDDLSPALHWAGNRFFNRFTDYAHRLGMRKALAYLDTEWGSLKDRAVLDVGCGRGRWTREFASRGCRVTGVDISPEAIGRLAEEMPQHTFLARRVTEAEFPPGAFDLVNSVTVLQHMPEESQWGALRQIGVSIKDGGYFVALENCSAFANPLVFPHSAEDWVRMVESTGLRLRASWGCNFEVLFRAWARLSARLRRRSANGTEVAAGRGATPSFSRSRNLLRSLVYSSLAVASYAPEWCCHKAPLAAPTHVAMVFHKPKP